MCVLAASYSTQDCKLCKDVKSEGGGGEIKRGDRAGKESRLWLQHMCVCVGGGGDKRGGNGGGVRRWGGG